MKIQIRQGCFETNSSSTHAICISDYKMDLHNLPEKVIFRHGDFSWGPEVLSTIEERASYLYQTLYELFYSEPQTLSAIINKIYSLLGKFDIDCEFEPVSKENAWNDVTGGYVDHVNCGGLEWVQAVLHSESRFLKYLFGDDSFVVIGNDNDDDYEKYMRNCELSHHELYIKDN